MSKSVSSSTLMLVAIITVANAVLVCSTPGRKHQVVKPVREYIEYQSGTFMNHYDIVDVESIMRLHKTMDKEVVRGIRGGGL